MKKCLYLLLMGAVLFGGAACSEPFITNTARSAVEQMLLCTVIERGVSKAEFARYRGKVAKMDYNDLATQVDKNLVIAYTEMHLACEGVIVSKSDDVKPDIIIQVSCGVLATDIDKFLLGTPQLPIPVMDTGISVLIPEIPLFRRICRSGHARFFFNVIDANTHKPLEAFVGLNAQAQYINWTVMLIPFKAHNLPIEDEARVSNEVVMLYEE